MSAADTGPEAIFQPGDLLNNTYRIEAILGRGGTSEVYRARSEISGRIVALKALRSEFSRNEDYLALMTREEDIREIRHDGIVRYYDNQRTDDGTVYLVMDFVDGPGLDQKLRQGGMSAPDLMIVARRVTEALAAAHHKKIVHRDLSPDNVILRHDDPAEAVIIDFGIAKDTNPGAETIVGNEFAGKYAYAAPEQLNGQADARSDIYSLGALLLSTFRGKPPKPGDNPMEVIRRKALPLDTEGVPEPLKTLIDRMSHPDRDLRLQSADKVLDLIRSGFEVSQPDGLDRTIVVPRPSAKTRPEGAAAPEPPVDKSPAVPHRQPQMPAKSPKVKPAESPQQRGRGGLYAVLALVVVAAIAGAGFWMGLGGKSVFGPTYPKADPYSLVAQRQENGTVLAIGNVPSETVLTELGALMSAQGGSAELTLSSGDISENWGADIVKLVKLVSDLPEWRIVANGNQVRITGLTMDAEEQARLSQLLSGPDVTADLQSSASIELGPRFLTAEMIRPTLRANADCGELDLVNAPTSGFPNEATILISGRVASTATQVTLTDALNKIKGARSLRLEIEVLNPTLCSIDAALPKAPQGGFDVIFGFGDKPGPNPTGRYFVGENPTIDVQIPASVTSGYLYVSALDVSGNVFHLLPNLKREDNSIATLRQGRSGVVTVRMAYGLGEAQGTGKLAFVVDSSALGKTKILVIHAKEKIFDVLRPTTESAAGYAEALHNLAQPVTSLDSRILTTALK